MNQQSLFDSVERRDEGMSRAEKHAERVIDNWKDRADASLREFARLQGSKSFLAEQWVEWAKRSGLPEPPDPRAYGPVVHRLARCGFLVKVGYAPANTSNHSPKCLWELSEVRVS